MYFLEACNDTIGAPASQWVSQGMRTSLNFGYSGGTGLVVGAAELIYRLGQGENGDDEAPGAASPGPSPIEREDLPYKVELWNAAKSAVEQVLAVTANGSIGYAAFYGATREFPDRYITLRHKNTVVSRWNGPRH